MKEKWFVVLSAVVVFGFAFLFIGLYYRNLTVYPETGIVTAITESENGYVVEFTVSNGNVFEYTTEDGDIEIDEMYSLLMCNSLTESVKDDKIVRIKYSSF